MKANRITALDAVRGFAVLLMVLDHVAVLVGAPWWVRGIVTRFALPLFMIPSGILYRPGWRLRHWQLLAAALISWPLAYGLLGTEVPILVLYVVLWPLFPYTARWPLLAIVLGLLQAWNLPVPWTGYEPGYVLAFVALGQLVRDRVPVELHRLGEFVDGCAWAGRHLLACYVGHLVVLAIVWGAAGAAPAPA